MSLYGKILGKLNVTGGVRQKLDNIQLALGRIKKDSLNYRGIATRFRGNSGSSQWGEDGIIQFLVNKVHIAIKSLSNSALRTIWNQTQGFYFKITIGLV